jgi:hypothetical protein
MQIGESVAFYLKSIVIYKIYREFANFYTFLKK